jgi:hypothetical protein
METSSQIFKSAIDKAYTTQPNVKINKNTMGDALKYKSSFTEEKDNNFSKNNQKEMVDGIVNIVKKVKDINNRMSIAKDMINKFKRENIKTDYNKFMKDCGLSDTKKIETKEVNDNQYKYETFLEKNKKSSSGIGKKKETKEATGSGSSGAYSGPVFGGNDEFWQRSKSETPNLKESVCAICGMKKCNCKDKKHGNAPIKTETKEATTSGSVGAYETPAMWAKSTNKKDWGPSRKTQYPGGGFVKIKNKCNKFPYCNQGDINNLTIVKNKTVKESIINVAKKLGINPNVVITILEHECETLNKRIK